MQSDSDDTINSLDDCPSCDGKPHDENSDNHFTFGVEIELQSINRTQKSMNELETANAIDELQKNDIKTTHGLLENIGIPVNPLKRVAPEGPPQPPNDIVPGHRHVKRKFQRWQVVKEQKEPLATGCGLLFAPSELASPAFFVFKEDNDKYKADYGARQIRKGAKQFSLLEQKKFVTAVWVAEDLLFELCPESRQGKRELLPISINSAAANPDQPYRAPTQEMKDHLPVGISWFDRLFTADLAHIWDAEDLKKIKGLLRQGDGTGGANERCALNIKGGTESDERMGTFEFRYPESSLDRDVIMRWVGIVVKFGELAKKDQVDYKQILGNLFQILEQRAIDLKAAERGGAVYEPWPNLRQFLEKTLKFKEEGLEIWERHFQGLKSNRTLPAKTLGQQEHPYIDVYRVQDSLPLP